MANRVFFSETGTRLLAVSRQMLLHKSVNSRERMGWVVGLVSGNSILEAKTMHDTRPKDEE